MKNYFFSVREENDVNWFFEHYWVVQNSVLFISSWNSLLALKTLQEISSEKHTAALVFNLGDDAHTI